MKKSFLRKVITALDKSLNPNGLSSYLELISPVLSRRQCFAKVIEIEHLNQGSAILTLRANSLWKGNTAGQFVGVGIIIDGVRLIRYYSPLTSGHGNIIKIGISRHPGGVVSHYLVDQAYRGMTVSLSEAGGEFTLPTQLPSKIRLLSAGSGFTAILSLVEYLAKIHYQGELVIVHYGPTLESIPCIPLFQQLLRRLPSAHFTLGITQDELHVDHVENAPSSTTHLSTHNITREKIGNFEGMIHYGRILAEHCAPLDSPEILTYACGPQGFIEAVRQLTSPDSFHAETFTPVLAAVPMVQTGTTVVIECNQSQKEVKADCGQSILDSVLDAGIPAKYGCKMGICFSCTTMKNRGIVRNALTNEVNAEPKISIQLCISLPESEIELEL